MGDTNKDCDVTSEGTDDFRLGNQRLLAENRRLKQQRANLLEQLTATQERLDSAHDQLQAAHDAVLGQQKAGKSFIVELWSKVFQILGWLSLFTLLRTCIPALEKDKYKEIFVEVWVLGHLLLSVLLLAICSAPGLNWWEVAASIYGATRIFQIMIYQTNVLLFDQYRDLKKGQTYAVRGYRRMVILLLHNYIEIIFWFALIYRTADWSFQTNKVQLDSFFESFNLSFVSMTTFGNTSVSPDGVLGQVLVLSQAAIGLFMALIVIARFLSLLPEPMTMDEWER